jgi:hypothetical protein
MAEWAYGFGFGMIAAVRKALSYLRAAFRAGSNLRRLPRGHIGMRAGLGGIVTAIRIITATGVAAFTTFGAAGAAVAATTGAITASAYVAGCERKRKRKDQN